MSACSKPRALAAAVCATSVADDRAPRQIRRSLCIGNRGSAGTGGVRRCRTAHPCPVAAADTRGARLPRSGGDGAARAGGFVRVPLGRRSLIGVVWDEAEDERGVELAADRLRTIDETLPLPPLASSLRRFVDRVAAYTMTPPGAVLRMSMSVVEALQPLRPRRLCTISPAGLAALADPGPGAPLTVDAPQGARNPARRPALGDHRCRSACRLRDGCRARPRQPRAGGGAPCSGGAARHSRA